MDTSARLSVPSAWDVEEIGKMPETGQADESLDHKVDDDADHSVKTARNITRPPKKWSYQDEDNDDGREKVAGQDHSSSSVYTLGDILWCRFPNSCFYPAVVTNDPHLKFCTKIVKAESLGGAVALPGLEGKGRQYHVQFLSDNRLNWVSDKYCLTFNGVSAYEQMVVNDVQNMKIYKPKAEKMLGWREAVLAAEELQRLEKTERVRSMETARFVDKGGKSFIKKVENETKMSNSSVASPTKAKVVPQSPKTGDKESKDQRRSLQYRRQDEMQYKMNRLAGRSSDGNKPKDKHRAEPEPNSKPATALPMFNTNASFSKSFKIKKDTNTETAPVQLTPKSEPSPAKRPEEERMETESDYKENNDSSVEHLDSSANLETDEEEKKDEIPDYTISHQKIEKSTVSEGLGEGALVWAKMRGYPFWPSVVSRDPMDGEFVKVADTIYKNSRRIHVLFLEYGNQRAWIGSSSIKKYKGIQQFYADKVKASKKSKPDYTPNKRSKPAFDKAVKYAEELTGLPDEERLERVLLKYGWAMVADTESQVEEETTGLTEEKKKSLIQALKELSDEETNTMQDDTKAEEGRSADSRRGSAEAESRIDPGTDDPDHSAVVKSTRPAQAKPKKRVSSIIATIAMNGDSSELDSDDDISPPPQKKSKHSSQSSVKKKPNGAAKLAKSETPVKSALSPSVSASIMSTPKTPSGTTDKDEFPRVGDLVWGRLPGFPFWPAFITRSPQNIYRKDMANGKSTFHVQFFGWNDESGWVTTALRFEGLDAFLEIAAKKKSSDKSYNPGKGPNYKKWEKAAKEAEDTMGLTRQERVDQYLVSYSHKLQPPSAPSPSPRPSPSATPKSSQSPGVAASGKPSSGKPGSGKPSAGKPGSGKPSAGKPSPAKPSSAKKFSLPRGWICEVRGSEGKQTTVYISPDGADFPSRTAMLRHISSEKKSLDVVYISDDTLPQGWRCQSIQSTVFFFSPIGERFDSRRKVAERMKTDNYSLEEIKKILSADKSRRPAPKSVLKRRGEYMTDESSQESEEEQEDKIIRLPKGHAYRSGGPYDKFLDIEKIFDPSDGGIIDMVQLPNIFLEHPTVRVQESDNEMIISDVDTGEFIAKKIIYD